MPPLLLSIAVALLAGSLSGQRVTRSFSVNFPTGGIGFDPVSRELLVVSLGDRLRIIPVDGGQEAEIRLPSPPLGGLGNATAADVCVDPMTARIWVADGRGQAYEIDRSGVRTGRAFWTTPLVSVSTIAWDPVRRHLLVARAGTQRVERFDEAGNPAGSLDLSMGTGRIKRIDWDPSSREYVVAHDDVITVSRHRPDGSMIVDHALRGIDVWPVGVAIDRATGSAFTVDDRINSGRIHEVSALASAVPGDAVVRYGSGCRLPTGVEPRLVLGGPLIGGGVTAMAIRQPAGSVSALLFGIRPRTMNLWFLGAPLCNLWTEPWVTVVPDRGPAERPAILLPIPPALAGLQFEAQAFVWSGGAVATTDAATLRVLAGGR
jgi:hypothetical protein